MFEDVFVSDNIALNIFVFIYMYWYLIVGLFAPAFYYIFLRIFTFPLITRKTHELVIMVSPESVKIKKITSRLTPFFYFKKGAYWFDEPCKDINTSNNYNIYVEGINQNITHKAKHEDKTHDVLKELIIPKQISSHKILLPTQLKNHLNRHFILVIEPDKKLAELRAVKERQPHRVSFYHTLGIYIQKTIEVEKSVEQEQGGGTKMLQLTTQLILEQIKFASQQRYYSSHYAYNLSKRVQRTEKYFISWTKGDIDPKIIISLVVLMGTVAGIFAVMYLFGNPQTLLGPMPT